MELLGILVIWALLACGVAALATSRGRSGVGFFLLSFLLSPLLGLIIVLIMTNLVAQDAKASERKRDEESRERLRREEHERQLASIKAIATPQGPNLAQQPLTAASGSVADEIRKLGALRAEGLLTDAEFQFQKSLLLSPSASASSPESPTSPTRADISSPAKCVAVLESLGSRVTHTSNGVWEILRPSGTTAYAHSFEDLKYLTLRYCSPPKVDPLVRIARGE